MESFSHLQKTPSPMKQKMYEMTELCFPKIFKDSMVGNLTINILIHALVLILNSICMSRKAIYKEKCIGVSSAKF